MRGWARMVGLVEPTCGAGRVKVVGLAVDVDEEWEGNGGRRGVGS